MTGPTNRRLVYVLERFPADTLNFVYNEIRELERRGHRIRRSGPWDHGRVLAVARNPGSGLCEAAASPRSGVAYAVALP